MKNKLLKNIALGIACTLGLGSVIATGVLLTQKQDNVIESKAEQVYEEEFYVGGVDIIADEDHHVELGDGYAEFDIETNTLTLHNCTYTGEGTFWREYYYQEDYNDYRAALMLKDFYVDITIVLEGENSFTCTGTEDYAAGVLIFSNHHHKATIVGEGSLTAQGTAYGFYCRHVGLIFESGTINAISTGATTGDIISSIGYYIYTASSGSGTEAYLHHYKKGAVINAYGGTLPSTSTYQGSYGFRSASVYNCIIDGATINATGGNVNNSELYTVGFRCTGTSMTIRNNTRIVAKGGEGGKSYGIDVGNSSKPVIISNDIKYLEFAGHTSAFVNPSRFKNSIVGLYASEFDGSGTLSTLGTNTGSNGKNLTTSNKNLKFQRITADVTPFNGDYDGNEHSISITNLDPADSTVEYSIDNGETWSTTLPTYVNAGEHSTKYRFTKTYFPTAEGVATVTINELDIPNVSVTVTSETIAYDGQPHSPTIATSPSSTGGFDVTFTYSATETGEFTAEIPEFIDAGTHTIYWKATCPNFKEASGSVQFTISETPTPTPEPDPGSSESPSSESPSSETPTSESSSSSEVTPIPPSDTNGGLPGGAIALIAVGGTLGLGCLALFALFLFNPRYVVDYAAKKVIRTIYVKEHYDMVLLRDTHLRKVRRNKVDVYKTRAEAEKALNK